MSLLQDIMDGSASSDRPMVDGDHSATLRVSRSWPAVTKNALRISLDRGKLENTCVAVPTGPESTEQSMYLFGAVGKQIRSSISQRKF